MVLGCDPCSVGGAELCMVLFLEQSSVMFIFYNNFYNCVFKEETRKPRTYTVLFHFISDLIASFRINPRVIPLQRGHCNKYLIKFHISHVVLFTLYLIKVEKTVF